MQFLVNILIVCLSIISSIPLFTQQWQPYNNGLGQVAITCMASNNEKLFIGTSKNGIFSSEINNNSWETVNNGLDTLYPGILSMVISKNNILAGTSYGLYLSTNNGSNWSVINENNLNPDYTPSGSLISISNDVLYAKNNSIYLSVNDGLNWELVAKGYHYKDITTFTANSQFIFAGSGYGFLLSSSNNGNNWDSVYQFPVSINALGADDKIIIVGTDKGIYISNDNGLNWITSNEGLSNLRITSILITGKYFFISTSDGVFMADKSSSIVWFPINNGLTNTSVSCLLLIENTLFAGTFKGGVFKLDLSPLSVDDNAVIDESISIFPNPFDNITNICFTVPYDGCAVNITVFDEFGKMLIAPLEKLYTQGMHGYNLESDNISSGLYYCQIRICDKIYTQKLVVIK